jgi:hypothetical protein
MGDKRFEYRLVWSVTNKSDIAQEELNSLGSKGFRVVCMAAKGETTGWCWTLEREIPPAHPYR